MCPKSSNVSYESGLSHKGHRYGTSDILILFTMKKVTSKKSGKIILTFAVIVFSLLLIQIITFCTPSLDQLNVFYKFNESYSLVDWNLPHRINIDLDNDSKIDTVMPSHCIILTSTSSVIPQNQTCTDSGLAKGFQAPIPQNKFIHSYIGRKNSMWFLIINTLGETKMYEINRENILTEVSVPILLKMDSTLYLLTHLYTLVL